MAPKLAYRSGNGRSAGRRGVGRLNPRRETRIQGNIGDRERGIRNKATGRPKFLACKRRRRGRAERRLLPQSETRDRARVRKREITVTAHNVRMLAVDGTQGVGRVLDVLGTYVCMYGHTYSKSMDQPGKVVNPARDQLNRENDFFPVPVRV